MRPDIQKAADTLRQGGLVLFPTETVYGLGANALNRLAIARVFELKKRPTFHPLICHAHSLESAFRWAKQVPPLARLLAEKFWPGPLTLILEKSDEIPELVTGGTRHVGLRVPSHPMALDLLRACEFPVAAPSANLFGEASVTRAEDLSPTLLSQVGLLLASEKACEVGVESTVLAFHQEANAFELLRVGGLEVERIESVVGKLIAASSKFKASGTLPRHYAPHTRVSWWKGETPPPNCALLTLTPSPERPPFSHVETLSMTGDLREAASRFFAALHRLDAGRFAGLYVTPFPNSGLGLALNDRVRRAVQSHST